MMDIKRKKGFTLIELLVVIAILGILTTIVMISYSGAQSRARDAKRKADVASIATAFTLYHQETKSWQLPAGQLGQGFGYFNFEYPGFTSLANYLVNKNFLPQEITDPKLPVDASGKALDYAPQYFVYKCFNNKTKMPPYTGVVIYAFLENPSSSDTQEYNKTHQTAIDYCEDNPDLYTKAVGGTSLLANYAVMVK